MNRNTIAALVVAIVAIAGVGLAAGGVVAQSDSTALVDDPVTPTNDTESIYLDATGADDMIGSGPVNVTVAVEGLTENETAGNGTVVDETTLSVAAGATESYDYTLADTDRDYDELHITADVETADETDLIVSTDWGTLQRASGGGGGGLPGGSSSGMIVVVVLLLGALYVSKED